MNSVSLADIMRQSQVAFGTSGARGLVVSMTEPVCAAYTQAFLNVLGQHFKFDRVLLGVDLRPSSIQIATYCARAIEKAGFSVEFCGELPTPALAYYSQTQQMPAVMVTGSHIPFDRNGLKFYRPDGEITKTDEEAMLTSHIEVALTESVSGEDTYSLPVISSRALDMYVNRYTDYFPSGMLQGFKLGLYEHSSVARDVIKQILEALGAQVMSLGRTDQFTPIDTEAVSDHDVAQGLAWSKQYGFDAIISTDGDGDRPLMSDETGAWLRGDIVGLLTAKYLGIDALAVPVSCNTAIEKSGYFKQVMRTRIGSPYVIAGMQTLNGTSIAGFEANGGFLLGTKLRNAVGDLDALPTRDAVLPVLCVLSLASQSKTTLSELLADLPQRITFSDRLQNFPNEISRQLIADLSANQEAFRKQFGVEYGDIEHQDLTDGLRATFATGDVVHLRPSGNAPELRCYAESSTLEKAKVLVQMTLGRLVRTT